MEIRLIKHQTLCLAHGQRSKIFIVLIICIQECLFLIKVLGSPMCPSEVFASVIFNKFS